MQVELWGDSGFASYGAYYGTGSEIFLIVNCPEVLEYYMLLYILLYQYSVHDQGLGVTHVCYRLDRRLMTLTGMVLVPVMPAIPSPHQRPTNPGSKSTSYQVGSIKHQVVIYFCPAEFNPTTNSHYSLLFDWKD